MSLFHTTPHFLTAGDGQALRLKEIAAHIIATGRLTHGAFSLAELNLPEGFVTHIHVHLAEDEAVCVLRGQLNILCNGAHMPASGGAFAFLPRGIPHGLTVVGRGPTTVLCIAVPAGMDGLMVELDALNNRPHAAVSGMDPVQALAAKYSIKVLGPLPPQIGEAQP